MFLCTGLLWGILTSIVLRTFVEWVFEKYRFIDFNICLIRKPMLWCIVYKLNEDKWTVWSEVSEANDRVCLEHNLSQRMRRPPCITLRFQPEVTHIMLSIRVHSNGLTVCYTTRKVHNNCLSTWVDPDQTARMLIWVYPGCKSQVVCFRMPWIIIISFVIIQQVNSGISPWTAR